jgi:hypothetical protein
MAATLAFLCLIVLIALAVTVGLSMIWRAGLSWLGLCTYLPAAENAGLVEPFCFSTLSAPLAVDLSRCALSGLGYGGWP